MLQEVFPWIHTCACEFIENGTLGLTVFLLQLAAGMLLDVRGAS